MYYIIASIFFIFLEAFFSGSETALVSANPLKLRHKKERGHTKASLAYSMLSRPQRFLITILVGTN